MRILPAAFAYFALAFAAGFVVGAVRVMVLAPALGEVLATLVEIPLMLTISWVAAGWVIRTFSVTARASPRLAMGVLAFALLIAAEIVLGVMLFDRTISDQIAELTEGAGLIGLCAQALFALIPAARLVVRRRNSKS